MIFQRMWMKANIKNRLYKVRDGEEALDFLFRRGGYTDAPEVSLILLDLNMPKMDGFEVLKKIRNSSSLQSLPVLILTGSNREEKMNRASELGCDGFVVKPFTFDNFMEAIADIQRYSLITADLPD